MEASTKESSPALSQDGTPTAQNAGAQASPRADAIGIEIPVVLYASRYSATGRGVSKAPPPVREETRTVIVFSQGAVVRLSATVSVGEMVVLTNQQTGADVLCRVGAVKAQAGIQNYVDLEFTQRAPGFWGAHSAGGLSARSEHPASEPEVRAVGTPPPPALLAPKQRPSSPSSLGESAPLLAAATPASEPAAVATPITPPALESPRSSPGRSVVPHVPAASNAVSSAGAAPRLAQPIPSMLMGERLDWTKQTPPSSKKALWAAIAAVFVAVILAGAFLLNHRGESTSPETGITVAAPSLPVQPADAEPVDESQTPVAAEPASSATAVPVPPPTWLSDTPQLEESQDENVAQPAPAPAPRRSGIPVGKLASPIARTPVITGSSEPPPVLLTPSNAATESILRSGVLSGDSRAEAPAAPPATGSSPVRPGGGQIQMPRLISSPDPQYPAGARAQNLEGVVLLDALVDAAGGVAEVKVISGPILLRQAAIDALRKWKYQPARLDGQPTAVHTNVNIRFALH